MMKTSLSIYTRVFNQSIKLKRINELKVQLYQFYK